MDAEALHKGEVRFGVELHPSKSSDVTEGVRDQLNELLLRYQHNLGGVLLSYSNERTLSTQARIHPYFPYFHLDVAAEVVVFRPRVGSVMSGRVHQIGQDYVGLLVLGIFNTVIPRDKIRVDFQCRLVENCWISSSNRHHRLEVGTTVRFVVSRVIHQGDFFSMAGSLMEAGTGAADVVAELAHQASLTTEKPVSAARANVLEQNGTAHVSLHIEKPRKKKKRKRKLEEGVEQPTVPDTAASVPVVSQERPLENGLKEKKHKKRKDRDIEDHAQPDAQKRKKHKDDSTDGNRKEKKRKHKDKP